MYVRSLLICITSSFLSLSCGFGAENAKRNFPDEGIWGSAEQTADIDRMKFAVFWLKRDGTKKDGWYVQWTRVDRDVVQNIGATCIIKTYGPFSARITESEIVITDPDTTASRISYRRLKDGTIDLQGGFFREKGIGHYLPAFRPWSDDVAMEYWTHAINTPPLNVGPNQR